MSVQLKHFLNNSGNLTNYTLKCALASPTKKSLIHHKDNTKIQYFILFIYFNLPIKDNQTNNILRK